MAVIDRTPAHPASLLAQPQAQTYLNQILAKLRQLQRQQQMLELTQQSNLAQPYSLAEQVTPESAPISNLPKLAKEPVRPPADRVVVFIDEANLYHAARSRGIKIDSPQLLKTLKDRSTDFQAIDSNIGNRVKIGRSIL